MSKQNSRQQVIIGVFVLSALALVMTAASLQLFDSKYKRQASQAAINKEIQYPSRGLIYDRNGKLLVYNNPLYDIQAVYKQIDPNMDTTKFCQLLNIDKETFLKNINKNWKSPRYHKSIPYTFLSKIKPENYLSFQEHLDEFPGFFPVIRNIRGYPHSHAAHVLGYLGEVNQTTVDTSAGSYIAGDYIGINGIERTYEQELRGSKGVKLTLKDNLGRKAGTYNNGASDSPAISGKDLISAIDLDLQAYGEELMQGKRGSIVAIEPKTGEILAMLSSPNFDPNIFNLDRDRKESIDILLQDSINRPSIDRSVMAKYPPASIFKPIMALIAMQEGISYPNRTIYCDGSYEVNTKGFSQGCRNHPTPYNVSIALEYSCNSYFYQLIREFLEIRGYNEPGKGLDLLVKYLSAFGLGDKLGVDIVYENSGFIPNSSYYDKIYATEYYGWKSTYVLSLGIGQGEIQLTTVQMANLAAILANRGFFYTPHIIKAYKNEYNQAENIKFTKNVVPIDSVYFPSVIKGMEDVIRTGTARMSFVPGLDICGKTGTSQNPHGEDHSVFFGFAPKDNPQIAIAVYVENAGHGGHIAAPIGSLMMEKYISKSISPGRQYVEKRMKETNLIEKPVL